MMLTKDAEDFLLRFRLGLAKLPSELREDLVKEVRSHFVDRASQGALDIGAAFGSPEEYAARFVSEQKLTSALASGLPWRIVTALLATARDATLLLVLVIPLASLELTGLVLVVLGAAKPFFPGIIGTYVDAQGRLQAIGSMGTDHGTHEVLGIWGAPLYVVGGAAMFWLCHRLLSTLVRWRVRKLRR